MPLFKRAIVEEATPTLYESAVNGLNALVSYVERCVPTPEQLQVRIDHIVDNLIVIDRIFLLTLSFVLFAAVLCLVPLSSPLDDDEDEDDTKEPQVVEEIVEVEVSLDEHQDRVSSSPKLVDRIAASNREDILDLLNVNKEDRDELLELTASSSSSSGGSSDDGNINDDDSRSDNDEAGSYEDIDDDASVEESYQDFLVKVESMDPLDHEVFRPSTSAPIAVAREEDENGSTETPSSSPPSDDDGSVRSSPRKRMSFKISKKTLSFRRASYRTVKKNH
eukprot:CAMPEP_0181083882 /NCGR_PEP_ID=MMETSP1071-20121207/4400_1 /TAXON_ID=35127 /ORGANISM="Thalassiosira sp., Strain NH16" /LENGTH=277 /DNA_ID=CAMNT_0023165581 /DNA_START=59 /DNA_END=892 /DNA_ORIENTATION=+